MPLKIALLPGDGIGPEVTEEAVRILKNVGEHAGKPFTFSTHPIGGVAIDAGGAGLPEQTLEACLGDAQRRLGSWGEADRLARALLFLAGKTRELEGVRRAADVYLRSGQGEHEHAALVRALEKAREHLGPGLTTGRL